MKVFQVGTTFILSDIRRLFFADLASPQELAKNTLNWFDDRGQLVIGTRRNPAHVAAWQDWHRREGWEVPGEKDEAL